MSVEDQEAIEEGLTQLEMRVKALTIISEVRKEIESMLNPKIIITN
ncbi:MAG: hypothetical protein U5L46_11635 [Agrobacterium sp.]|nr:hypothetical protein [Agrobacterium sp.]